jgi:hypothetical protein
MTRSHHLSTIRFWLALFIVGLVLSGVTAFPLQTELGWLHSTFQTAPLRPIAQTTGVLPWIARVYYAVSDTNQRYPFLAYGTDWLAFGHLVIAVAFIGPYMDPICNKWIITFGLIACAGVFPLAFIAGNIRGIPIWWRLIDCSFGFFGSIPLLLCRRTVATLERMTETTPCCPNEAPLQADDPSSR